MRYFESKTLEGKIEERIKEINDSFPKKELSLKFRKRFENKEADTLYKHIPDYAKVKFGKKTEVEDYVVNVGVWQEFLVKTWLDNINLQDIKVAARRKDFFNPNRKNCSRLKTENEKVQCRNLKAKKCEVMGEILDYQVPLKARSWEKTYNEAEHKGELDLVAHQDNEMVIIEYKIPNSTEPLLRAVLEVITYFHQIDGFNPKRSKYLQSFNETFFKKDDKSTCCNTIGLAIVVPKVAYQFGHRRAYELIEKYHIKCYEFQDERNFENIKLLLETEITNYRNQAEKNLEGIYQNSDLIISKMNLI